MNTGHFYYFGFASNMLKERMLYDNPTAVKIFHGPAKLDNYKLTFARDWPMPGVWHGPGATLRKCAGSHVWGVVWKLEQCIKADLDKQETTHKGIDVVVTDLKGQKIKCYVFLMDEGQGQEELPSPQYKDVIIRGAKQSGLPEEYVQYLKSLKDSGYTGCVPIYEELLKVMGQK